VGKRGGKRGRRKGALQDPYAKRPHETDLEWRSRTAHLGQTQRNRFEPLVTLEAEGHGDYEWSNVMHVETGQIAVTKRNRRASAMTTLHERGQITDEQYASSNEIARVVEIIESAVSVRGASLEARVDNSGAGRDVLIERLWQVQIEATYTKWRDRLPMPRRMYVDMIVCDRTLMATARSYGVPWVKARKHLFAALDRWGDFREAIWRNVDEDDVARIHRWIGCGRLV
jgi:hypothetical protein